MQDSSVHLEKASAYLIISSRTGILKHEQVYKSMATLDMARATPISCSGCSKFEGTIQGREWLEHFVSLSNRFHSKEEGCGSHKYVQEGKHLTKLALNYYCTTCNEGPVCQYGKEENHANHQVLKTKVLNGRVCVDVESMNIVDETINYIQIHTYVTNGTVVIFLIPKMAPCVFKNTKFHCSRCLRSLNISKKNIDARDVGLRFCSLQCKLEHVRLNPTEDVEEKGCKKRKYQVEDDHMEEIQPRRFFPQHAKAFLDEPLKLFNLDTKNKTLSIQGPSTMLLDEALNQLRSCHWRVEYFEACIVEEELAKRKEPVMILEAEASDKKVELYKNRFNSVSLSNKLMHIFNVDNNAKTFSVIVPYRELLADMLVAMMGDFSILVVSKRDQLF